MQGLYQAKDTVGSVSPSVLYNAFTRRDEESDPLFYEKDRFVEHLDSLALATVQKIVEDLVIEEKPAILDLMAGWDSHLPASLEAGEVVGLGLNENELRKNDALTRHVVHDLNLSARLPFPDACFDVVLNTVSVDYMTRPVEVFREVARILKPGGLFLVIFSNRFFPEKVVRIWETSSEDERVLLVDEFFKLSSGFGETTLFASRHKPRPTDDRYTDRGIPSDPIYALYAERKGGDPARRPRPYPQVPYGTLPTDEEIAARKGRIKETLRCPYCGERMQKWRVPDNPFCQTWDNEFMYICFNDLCPYYVRGWDVLYRETNQGVSYRCMYNPEKDRCFPIPVPTPFALREGIENA